MTDRDDMEPDDAVGTPSGGGPVDEHAPVEPRPVEGPEVPAEPQAEDLAEPITEPEPPSRVTTNDIPEDRDEPEPPRRRLTARGVVAVGARGVAGVIGIAVATAVIAAATIVTGPGYSVTPPEVSVSPVPAAQQRVCAGPLLRLGDDTGQAATTASSVGRASATYQATPGNAEADDLPATDNNAGVAPLLLTLPPDAEDSDAADSDDAPALAGSQSQRVASGDLVGLAAAECAEAGGDTWLVGGSTAVGRTTLLTISNPSTVIATVGLTIYAESGAVAAPGAEGIIVPPGTQRIFSLAGFAPGLVSPVIRVQSRGGQVVANLQQSIVRTLEPGGVDIIGQTRGPSQTTVIPGLVVSGAAAVTAAQGRLGYDDLQTALRLFLPGEDDASVTVTITPEQGAAGQAVSDASAVEGATPGETPGAATFDLDLDAGEVTDVPLPGLVDGSYTVSIESEAPIVAGARMSTVGTDGATDFAWLAAAKQLGDSALVSVASGPSPILHLANPGDTDATVTVESDDGELVLDVPAGLSVATPLPSGSDLRLSGAVGLVAAVGYLGDGQLAAFRVTPPRPASTDITIYR